MEYELTGDYTEDQKRSGFFPTLGSKVTVIRKSYEYENGWENTWVDEMNNKVGKIGVIESILSGNKGYQVKFPEKNEPAYAYPFFVLMYEDIYNNSELGDDIPKEQLKDIIYV